MLDLCLPVGTRKILLSSLLNDYCNLLPLSTYTFKMSLHCSMTSCGIGCKKGNLFGWNASFVLANPIFMCIIAIDISIARSLYSLGLRDTGEKIGLSIMGPIANVGHGGVQTILVYHQSSIVLPSILCCSYTMLATLANNHSQCWYSGISLYKKIILDWGYRAHTIKACKLCYSQHDPMQ